MAPSSSAEPALDLDLRGEVCPYTFVRAKLALEGMPAEPAIFLGQRGKGNRRRVHLDPAPQFLYPRVLGHRHDFTTGRSPQGLMVIGLVTLPVAGPQLLIGGLIVAAVGVVMVFLRRGRGQEAR